MQQQQPHSINIVLRSGKWRLRPGGYLTSLGLGLPKDQLLLQKVTSTTVLLGLRVASPDERDY